MLELLQVILLGIVGVVVGHAPPVALLNLPPGHVGVQEDVRLHESRGAYAVYHHQSGAAGNLLPHGVQLFRDLEVGKLPEKHLPENAVVGEEGRDPPLEFLFGAKAPAHVQEPGGMQSGQRLGKLRIVHAGIGFHRQDAAAVSLLLPNGVLQGRKDGWIALPRLPGLRRDHGDGVLTIVHAALSLLYGA